MKSKIAVARICLGQENLNQPAWRANGKPDCVAYSCCSHHANDFSIDSVYRASTGTVPSCAINEEIVRALTVYHIGITGDVSKGAEWNLILERESSKRDRSSRYSEVWLERYRDNPIDATRYGSGAPTSGNVNGGVPSTVNNSKREDTYGHRRYLFYRPDSDAGQVKSAEWTGTVPVGICDPVDNMGCRDKSPVHCHEKSGSFNRDDLIMPRGKSVTNNGQDGAFDFSDCIGEFRWSYWDCRGDWMNLGASHQVNYNQQGAERFYGLIHNDGSFSGNCVITKSPGKIDYKCPE